MSSTPGFSRSTHLSIVWGVTLAVLTLMEWRALDRDPLGHQILTPFIHREVTVSVEGDSSSRVLDFDQRDAPDTPTGGQLQYEVEIDFNGPLFLACFFGPVLLFQGLGWLGRRGRQ